MRRMINLESIGWVKKRSKKSSKHEEMPCTNESQPPRPRELITTSWLTAAKLIVRTLPALLHTVIQAKVKQLLAFADQKTDLVFRRRVSTMHPSTLEAILSLFKFFFDEFDEFFCIFLGHLYPNHLCVCSLVMSQSTATESP